jgi:hypothetical protein
MRCSLGIVVATFALLFAFTNVASYKDGPPPSITGGLGETDCRECHFDRPVNSPGGAVAVLGLNEKFKAGEQYVVTVELTANGMETAGFELSVRFIDGRQAGNLAALDGRVSVETAEGIQYARQTADGSKPGKRGRAQWEVSWLAPIKPDGAVVMHVAANVGNGDDSPLGDLVYVNCISLEPKFAE